MAKQIFWASTWQKLQTRLHLLALSVCTTSPRTEYIYPTLFAVAVSIFCHLSLIVFTFGGSFCSIFNYMHTKGRHKSNSPPLLMLGCWFFGPPRIWTRYQMQTVHSFSGCVQIGTLLSPEALEQWSSRWSLQTRISSIKGLLRHLIQDNVRASHLSE